MHTDIVLTDRDGGHRLTQLPALVGQSDARDPGRRASIYVDEEVAYQEIEGFGGAFTEAAATTLLKLPSDRQEEVLRAYFDAGSGHAYTLCRTHINSCDFSLGNYAYCEKDGDLGLETFSIERDRQALIPMIKRAQKMSNSGFKLFASPWSPPAWMKTTGQMNRGGKLKPECRDAWARYYVRYIREYEKEGIPIWGLTVQNEPDASQKWDSCLYTAEEEKDFVRDHLGPTLHAAGLENVKVIIWDHNRDMLFERARVAYTDPEAARYIWGTGFHWYVTDTFDNVQRTHDAFPDKKLLFTEGCQEFGTHQGAWLPAERYARSVINDLNRWTVGWVDWNLLLDETGGPNHVENFCSAPIIADTRVGEVRFQASYYYLGHFSRFIRPEARRVLSAVSSDDLEALACKNPDGTLAVVVLNRTEQTIPFTLRTRGEAFRTESPRRSILTMTIKA